MPEPQPHIVRRYSHPLPNRSACVRIFTPTSRGIPATLIYFSVVEAVERHCERNVVGGNHLVINTVYATISGAVTHSDPPLLSKPVFPE